MMRGLSIPIAIGLLLPVVPDPLPMALGGGIVAWAILSPRARRRAPAIDARLLPAALFLLLAAVRGLGAPLLAWDSMLGWLVAVAAATHRAAALPAGAGSAGSPANEAWRDWCPPFAAGAAATALLGLTASTLPAIALAAVAWLDWRGLDSRARAWVCAAWLLLALAFWRRPEAAGASSAAVLGLLLWLGGRRQASSHPVPAGVQRPPSPVLRLGPVCLAAALALHGATLPAVSSPGVSGGDLSGALTELDGWWRAQVGTLELSRQHPLLGVGPGRLRVTEASAAPGSTQAEARVPCALAVLLAEHGWVGYALLALSFHRLGWLASPPAGWVVLLCLLVAPGLDSTAGLRLAPLAGLLGAASIRPRRQGAHVLTPLRPRSSIGLQAAALTAGLCLSAWSLGRGTGDLLIVLGDRLALRLDWPAAETLYSAAARTSPQPELALHRLSDLRLRRSRYLGHADLARAREPLLDSLALGLEDGFTFYRLAEIEQLLGDPRGVARLLYEQAAARAPSSPLVWVALGHCALNQRRPDTAVEAFRRAIELEPRLLERLFRDVRRISTNRSLLRRVLPPGQLERHVELALLFERTGMVPAALAELELLLRGPEMPGWVRMTYADLLARSGRHALALQELHELARWSLLGPRERLGVLVRLGRLERSPAARRRSLSEALALLPVEELSRDGLEPVLAPLLEGGPSRAAPLLRQAIERLESIRALRPELADRRLTDLRLWMAELEGGR